MILHDFPSRTLAAFALNAFRICVWCKVSIGDDFLTKVNTGATSDKRLAVILTDDPGWHGARLREAFESRGVEVSFASLRDCRFDLDRPGRDLANSGVISWMLTPNHPRVTWPLS